VLLDHSADSGARRCTLRNIEQDRYSSYDGDSFGEEFAELWLCVFLGSEEFAGWVEVHVEVADLLFCFGEGHVEHVCHLFVVEFLSLHGREWFSEKY
jgi:hypothetical protein